MGNDAQGNGQGAREWRDHSLKDISESFRRRAFALPRPDESADVQRPPHEGGILRHELHMYAVDGRNQLRDIEGRLLHYLQVLDIPGSDGRISEPSMVSKKSVLNKKQVGMISQIWNGRQSHDSGGHTAMQPKVGKLWLV